jgi:manganese oxidase
MLHCHLPHHMMNQMSSDFMGEPMTNGPVTQARSIAATRAMQSQMSSGTPATGKEQMDGMMAMDMSTDAIAQQNRTIAPNASSVPNFPQDGYMEGPTMNMERNAMLDKPENHGLRAGWSASMQGMMTFVRVLPPDTYDEVIAAMRNAKRTNDPYAALLNQEGARA